jgi:hypothetical protein
MSTHIGIWTAVGMIAAGCVAVVVSIFGKEFRNTDVETMTTDYGAASTWSGKLLFGFVGAAFLFVGIRALIK